MFAISKKVTTLRLLLFGIFITAVVSIAGMLAIRNNNDSNAVTINGDIVGVGYYNGTGTSTVEGYEDVYTYFNLAIYNSLPGPGWYGSTHYFYVRKGDVEQRAFCVNAEKHEASGNFDAREYETSEKYGQTDIEKDDLIKLAIYAYNHRGSDFSNYFYDVGRWVKGPQEVGAGFVGGRDDGVPTLYFSGTLDDYYAYTHAVVAYIYDGSRMGYYEDDVFIVDLDYGLVSEAIGRLISSIRDNSVAWQKAKSSKLFRATPPASPTPSTMQDVMWIEEPVRGDVKFTKIDSSNNTPMANTVFKLSRMDESNRVVETHIVVSDENGVVDTSANAHSNHTNGYDELFDEGNISYEGYGTWFSRVGDDEVEVNDYLGALPFGTYLIEEQKCDANRFCYGLLNQQKTFTVDDINVNVDLGDWENECAVFSIDTEALDKTDEDNYVEEGEVTIVDTIRFCAKPGLEFRIEGILMDKETGEPLLIDGNPVTGLLEKVKTENADGCDIKKMEFTFDATGLGGKELVVFESLYYDGEQDPLAVHDDINAEKQTITVLKLKTNAMNKETGDKTLPYGEDVVIRDVVTYCLKPGTEYTIEGTLMNKATKEVVTINGEPVTQTVTFTPEEACGEFDMDYELNTEDLAGADLVIFENLYIDGELVIEHKDFENECETVTVEIPTPDTGYITKEVRSGSSESSSMVLYSGAIIVITFGGYAVKRVMARRRW